MFLGLTVPHCIADDVIDSQLTIEQFPPEQVIKFASESGKWHWVHTFSMPCQFENGGFDSTGTKVPRDPISIYDGMKIWVNRNGEYKIRFRADVPRIPVVIRVQLHLQRSGPNEKLGVITLPPIRLNPDGSEETPSRQFVITVQGTSDTLRQLIESADPAREGIRVATEYVSNAKRRLIETEANVLKAQADVEAMDPNGVLLKDPELKEEAKPTAGDKQLKDKLMKAPNVKAAFEKLDEAKNARRIAENRLASGKERLNELRQSSDDELKLPPEPMNLSEIGLSFTRHGSARFGVEKLK
jgi:hypothetical protein